MKRIYLALALCVALAASASAQMTMTGVGGGFGSAAAAPTFTNFTSGTNGSCGFSTSCTVSSLTVPSGFIVVAVGADNGGAGGQSMSTLTLCGTSMTLQASITSAAATGVGVALFYGTVTGGTCSAAITSSQAMARASVALGQLSNLSSTTPGTGCTGTQSPSGGTNYPCSSGITVPAGGFGVAAIGYGNVTAMTASNLTIGVQQNNAGVSIGIAYTTTSNTPAFQGAAVQHGGIVAAPWS